MSTCGLKSILQHLVQITIHVNHDEFIALKHKHTYCLEGEVFFIYSHKNPNLFILFPYLDDALPGK
ncbi:MAG TPA: hypothetical protein DCR45_05965 [Gammaproteobacteria bacterium]|nr:hypothetical protein [Gammaproteobacteria bacterium]HBJ91201.1 hypothetical protein [Gammaproteobacteria bacterium]